MRSSLARLAAFAIAVALCAPAIAGAADKKPNILVIWGDDIGIPTSAPTTSA